LFSDDLLLFIQQVAKPVYRAMQLLNKLANGRIFRSDSQPEVDSVDVWGTLDDATQTNAKHAVFITNFNVSCDAMPLPPRSLNLTLRTSHACAPSAATVYTIDDVNGAVASALLLSNCTRLQTQFGTHR
jgi:ClpP class serine protease